MKKVIAICMMTCILSGCVNIVLVPQEPKTEVGTSVPAEETFDSHETESEASLQKVPESKTFDTLTKEEKKKLNIFFSNFAEAYFDAYDANDFSAAKLISFAFLHNRVNGTSEEEYNMFESPYFNFVMGFKTEVMDMLIDRYFGVKVPHEDVVSINQYGRYEGWAFQDGYVYTEAASGEFYDFCAIANTLVDNGDGTYLAEYDTYATELGMMDAKYYSYTPDEARNDAALSYCESYQAVIKPVTIDGKETWQLLKLEAKN